ncbi:sugar phosphate nucleotidyltransferase, partial [Methanothrix sp.]|uniref:sugar phosphate nucleotidyltransferase n=1 Tax=Methanothrix sp. TaxID=90426 RepID=UPI0034E27C37
MASGYYWNSGMFLFSSGLFREECLRHAPEIAHAFEGDPVEAYSRIEGISTDHGLMEKTAQAAVVPLYAEWNDLGSFDSLYHILTKDKTG